MQKAKILVVDDEAEICAVTKSFLTKRNYDVLIAADEPAALEALKKQRPDLVLLDVRLGGVSGIEVLRKIKEINKDTKVIMVTALDDEDSVEQAKSFGADGYITKPFTAESLSRIIAEELVR